MTDRVLVSSVETVPLVSVEDQVIVRLVSVPPTVGSPAVDEYTTCWSAV